MLQVPRTCLAPPLEQGICLRKIQLYFLRTTKKVTKTSTCVTLAASVPALLFLSTSPALPSSHPALVCIKTFFRASQYDLASSTIQMFCNVLYSHLNYP